MAIDHRGNEAKMRYSDRTGVRYCTRCGVGTGSDDRFCANCGQELPSLEDDDSSPGLSRSADQNDSNSGSGFGKGFAQGCGCSVALIVGLLIAAMLLVFVCTAAVVVS